MDFLEDLTHPSTVGYMDQSNQEVRSLLWEKAEAHYNKIVVRLREEAPLSVVGLDEGYATLYRSPGGGYVDLGGTRFECASKEETFHALERVWNTKMVRVGVGIRGSDEGYSLLLDDAGRVTQKFTGLVAHFSYLDGQLCYVREYRKQCSPDGVNPPVQRIFLGQKMLSFYPERGEALNVKAMGHDLIVIKSHGWSDSTLYVYSGGGFKEVDRGKILEAAIVGGKLHYLKLDTVMVEGEPLFRTPSPVLDAKFTAQGVVVEEIRDYRTTLVKYSYDGEPLWEYRGQNVYSYDVVGEGIVALETSFDTHFRVLDIRDGTPKVVRVGRTEPLDVVDVYVKSDVLLHGFLLSKKRSRGVVVYGYGGFSVPLLPSFNPLFQELLDAGFSVLVTNLRGGYEHGEEWHRQGVLDNKVNVFRDYAAFLGLAKKLGAKTVGMGASNGGLLVGATANMFPHLFDVAVIGYPVLDMLNYHRFLAGMYWVPEYGDPEGPLRGVLENYSPIHNLKSGLPPSLVYTGANDDRVHPMHALKYVAKSRSLGNRVLLFVNTESGHNLSQPESRAEEAAYIVAFIEEFLDQRVERS